MARESSTSDRNVHSCSTIWCAPTAAAEVRAATDAAETKHAWNASAAQHQVAAEPQLGADRLGAGRSGDRVHALVQQRARNRLAVSTCAATLAMAEPVRPETDDVHQDRAQDRGQAVASNT